MQAITTFNELLAKASNPAFYLQQQMVKKFDIPTQQAWLLVDKLDKLIELAKTNDSLAAKLVRIEQVRALVKTFADLKQLAGIAPETTAELLQYSQIRTCIGSFKQLLELLNTIEVLRITLPPHKDVRALLKTPQHLEKLGQIRVNKHSNSNLAQLFISYADVRKRFKSFKQLLQFIVNNPGTSQLFMKDKHTISLVKNARQLNCLLTEISKYNTLWSKNAALELTHSSEIAKLFKKQPEVLDYLNHLPDQESIRTFINNHKSIADLLDLNQSKTSMIDMEFYKAKKPQLGKPSIPFNLLQYA